MSKKRKEKKFHILQYQSTISFSSAFFFVNISLGTTVWLLIGGFSIKITTVWCDLHYRKHSKLNNV